MIKFTKLVAVLFIIAMVFGCASSKSSKTAATGAKQKPTGTPSATIHFEAYQFMAILEGGWGHGKRITVYFQNNVESNFLMLFVRPLFSAYRFRKYLINAKKCKT